MKLGILKTDAVRPEWVDDFGEYADMFQQLLGPRDPELEFKVYDVMLEEYPQDVDEVDAYLITGSKFSVYEDLPWIHRLLEFIRELHERQKKTVGICFGHQAVAQALGGRAARADDGWGVGLHEHVFQSVPEWFDGGDPDFDVLVMHQDQVLENAPGAKTLASSAFCPNAVSQLGEHMLTFQGHPEFVNAYSSEIIRFRWDLIGQEKAAAGLESLSRKPETDRMAAWILSFLRSPA